jgi:hypothetical protein
MILLTSAPIRKSAPIETVVDQALTRFDHGHRDRGRDTTLRGTPRTVPDGRLLAHPVLIADDWRQSGPRDKGGVHAGRGAIGQPEREHVSMRSGASGSGGVKCATNAQ